MGSFPWVSAGFQPPELGSYSIDLAHNDHVQWLAEAGLAGLLLMAAALALLLRRALQGAGRAAGSRSGSAGVDVVSVGCALGLLAAVLHAWVDYPFHIPANSMLAATLLGWLVRERANG